MRLARSVLLVLFVVGSASAIGEAGAQFLKMGVGARACAMGEAFAAVADDASAVYWNPAGLAQRTGVEFLGMQNFWLLDMSYQYVAGAFDLGPGRLGAAVAYSSSGTMSKYEDFVKTGDYTAYDAAATVSYAGQAGFVAYGLSLKLIQEQIETENATGFGGDIGLLVTPPGIRGFRAGLAVQNLGPGIKFIQKADPLPLNVKLGAAYKLGPVLLAADVNKPIDNAFRANLGAEVSIRDLLFLRGGYNTAHSYSAGLGVRWRMVGVDYAFTPYADIDASHRISVQVRF